MFTYSDIILLSKIEYIKCDFCGKSYERGSLFCPSCGLGG